MGQGRRSTAASEPATRLAAFRGRRPRRKDLPGWRLATTVAAVMVVAAVAVWALTATSGPKPRTRHYLAFRACLLTDARGVTGHEAAPVWAGMEKASLKTHAKVQNLPAFGPATKANTQPYLRTLIGQGCDVILAAGAASVTAVTTEAPAHPKIHFIVVGNASTAHNLTVVDPTSNVPATISDTLIREVRNARTTR